MCNRNVHLYLLKSLCATFTSKYRCKYKSPVMRDIAMNGHAKCGFAMTLQYCMDVGPDLRTHFQYINPCEPEAYMEITSPA